MLLDDELVAWATPATAVTTAAYIAFLKMACMCFLLE
jgi:hypothetical protein